MTAHHDFPLKASFELFHDDKKLLLCCLRLSFFKRDTLSTGGTKSLLQTLIHKIGSAPSSAHGVKRSDIDATCGFEHSFSSLKFLSVLKHKRDIESHQDTALANLQ